MLLSIDTLAIVSLSPFLILKAPGSKLIVDYKASIVRMGWHESIQGRIASLLVKTVRRHSVQ